MNGGESPRTVRVWRVRVEVPTPVQLAVLSADEYARAARFRLAPDRSRFVAARSALRHLLASECAAAGSPTAPERLVFATGAAGKPFLAVGPPAVRFNVSHAGDWALIAIAADREVGVDVEAIPGLPLDPALLRHALAPAERAAVEAAAPDHRAALFADVWTFKEALLKATGQGLRTSPASIDVSGAVAAGAVVALEGCGCTIRAVDVAPGYRAAVAAQNGDWRVAVETYRSP